jgi:acyl-CoA thioester hydrolase
VTYVLPIQVRWADYDASGHVNNATFFAYLEQARMMMLAGLLGAEVWDQAHQVIRAQSIEYTQALTLAESPIEVVISRRRLGTTSYTLDYRVVSAFAQHAFATCTVVTLDPVTGAPVPLPVLLREGLEQLGELDPSHLCRRAETDPARRAPPAHVCHRGETGHTQTSEAGGT